MSKQFLDKKKSILESLSVPDSEYTDLSPKGSVDEAIRGLVHSINSIDSLVTTSSCSGRFVVYLDGETRDSSIDRDAEGIIPARSKGGKGGGTWLFTSHTPVTSPFSWLDVATSSKDTTIGAIGPLDLDTRLVHCKFEPMILHVLASSLDSAKAVLTAAQTAGFRESGISSVKQSSTGNVQMVMVAVRTTGLAFDSIVASCGQDGILRPAVDNDYMQKLSQHANTFFALNAQRIGRFETALVEAFSQPAARGTAAKPNWESSMARAARKRAEGQANQIRGRHAAETSVTALDLQSLDLDSS